MTLNKVLKTTTVAALAGWGAYLLFKNAKTLWGQQGVSTSSEIEGVVPSQIADQLPIAKDLQTVPDAEANYDIDGVSFDTEGVIVSSDAQADKSTLQ